MYRVKCVLMYNLTEFSNIYLPGEKNRESKNY